MVMTSSQAASWSILSHSHRVNRREDLPFSFSTVANPPPILLGGYGVFLFISCWSRMGSRCSLALSKSPSGIGGCCIATDLLGHFGLWEFHMTDALCRYLQVQLQKFQLFCMKVILLSRYNRTG